MGIRVVKKRARSTQEAIGNSIPSPGLEGIVGSRNLEGIVGLRSLDGIVGYTA